MAMSTVEDTWDPNTKHKRRMCVHSSSFVLRIYVLFGTLLEGDAQTPIENLMEGNSVFDHKHNTRKSQPFSQQSNNKKPRCQAGKQNCWNNRYGLCFPHQFPHHEQTERVTHKIVSYSRLSLDQLWMCGHQIGDVISVTY